MLADLHFHMYYFMYSHGTLDEFVFSQQEKTSFKSAF